VCRPQTRRRRENDSGAFNRLRNLKANLDMGRAILEWLQRREKRKRDIMQCEMDMQVLQLRLRHDPKQVRFLLWHL
jgi:enhancer of polycomb-like protein